MNKYKQERKDECWVQRRMQQSITMNRENAPDQIMEYKGKIRDSTTPLIYRIGSQLVAAKL